jgi:hypothetical protein
MEALGQDVGQEPANELAGGEPHGLEATRALDPIVLDLEGDAALVGGDQAAVGDGDAVGVAGQIGEHGLRPAERLLRIDDPLRSPERRQEGGERAGFGKSSMFAEEHQLAGVMRRDQHLDDEAPEQAGEDTHRQEEVRPTRDPHVTVIGEPAAGYDHVHVGMMRH